MQIQLLSDQFYENSVFWCDENISNPRNHFNPADILPTAMSVFVSFVISSQTILCWWVIKIKNYHPTTSSVPLLVVLPLTLEVVHSPWSQFLCLSFFYIKQRQSSCLLFGENNDNQHHTYASTHFSPLTSSGPASPIGDSRYWLFC